MSCVLLWNRDESPQNTELILENLPFDEGKVEIYLIDDETYSYPEESKFDIVPYKTIAFDNSPIEIEVGSYGFAYIKVLNEDKITEDELPDARIIRKYHYYPNRGSGNYAEFNKSDWSLWLGMGEVKEALSIVGIELEDAADKYTIHIDTTKEIDKYGKDAYVGVRIDYKTGESYVKAVEYHIICDNTTAPEVPWGTTAKADIVNKVQENEFIIDILGNAPEDWEGKAILTFELQNSGEDSEVVFRVRE